MRTKQWLNLEENGAYFSLRIACCFTGSMLPTASLSLGGSLCKLLFIFLFSTFQEPGKPVVWKSARN